MKTILILLASAALCCSADTAPAESYAEGVLTPLGFWPICEALPDWASFCTGQPVDYLLEMWGTSTASEFTYTITATNQEGVPVAFTDTVERNQNNNVTVAVIAAGTHLHGVQIEVVAR